MIELRFDPIPWQCWHIKRLEMALACGRNTLPDDVGYQHHDGSIHILTPMYPN